MRNSSLFRGENRENPCRGAEYTDRMGHSLIGTGSMTWTPVFDLMQKLMDGGALLRQSFTTTLFSRKAGTLAAEGAVLTASRPDQLGDDESTKKWEESQA